MSIVPAVKGYNRRRQGRPRNPNRKPNDAHLACRREDIDELDRLFSGYSQMPLGVKFSRLIQEYKALKKVIGQPLAAASLPIQTQLIKDTYFDTSKLNGPLDSDTYKKVWAAYDQ